MTEYKFYLNNTLVEEPIGWNKSKKKLKRSDVYKAIFLEYINDLEFHSDGYDYIKSQLQEEGFCTQISALIMYSCSEFTGHRVYFRGIINLQDAEFDEEKCLVKVNIEDNTLTGIITRLADTTVPFDSTKTITGQALSAIDSTIRIHNITTGAYSSTRTGYFVSDAFQYILNYITDNNVTFASDHFQTDTISRGIATITFTNPTVELVNTHAIPTVSISYINAFGQTITATATKQATVAATLNYLISQLNYNTSGGTAAEQFYEQDFRYIAKATTNGTSTITLVVDLPDYRKVSVVGANANFVDFVDPVVGYKMIALSTGNQLRNANTQVPNLSFNDVFKEMDKSCDLGMSIEVVNSVTVLRIEPIEYFFNITTIIADLENVIGLKFRQSKEFSRDTIKNGDGNDNRGVVGSQTAKSDWVSASLCSGEKVDIKNDWILDSDELYEQFGTSDDAKDDKIFLMECLDQGPNDADTAQYLNYIYNTTGASKTDYYAYNSYLTNYMKIVNWLFNIKGNPKFKDKTITNTKILKFEKTWQFEHPLTISEHNTIIASKDQFIRFNKETNSSYTQNGWIKEIDFDNTTGLCTFNLLTK